MESTQQEPSANTVPLILAVMEDLFFGIKVAEAARKAGARIVFAKTPEAFAERMADEPALVVLDLNYHVMQPLALIRHLRENIPAQKIPLVGFLPHVQEELRREAFSAGCDRVLPRSAFATQVDALVGEAVRTHVHARTA